MSPRTATGKRLAAELHTVPRIPGDYEQDIVAIEAEGADAALVKIGADAVAWEATRRTGAPLDELTPFWLRFRSSLDDYFRTPRTPADTLDSLTAERDELRDEVGRLRLLLDATARKQGTEYGEAYAAGYTTGQAVRAALSEGGSK